MAGIQFNFSTGNTNLPIEQNLFDKIKDIAGYKAWFQPETDGLAVTGAAINTWLDVGGGPATLALNTAGKAQVKSAAINGLPSAEFYQAGAFNVYTGSGFTFDWGQSWTEVIVYKALAANAGSDYKALCGPTGSTAARSILSHKRDVAELSFLYGTSGLINIPSAHGEWHAVIAGYRLAGTTMRAWIDGVDLAPVVAAAVTNTGLPRIGDTSSVTATQPLNGEIADLMFFQADLFNSPEDLAAIKMYLQNVYGLG